MLQRRYLPLLIVFLMLLGVLFFLFVPQPAVAQTGLIPPECADSVKGCNFCTFMAMVKNIVDLIFQLLAVIAVIMMVVAGLKLATSAGNVSAMEQSKQMITNVVIGFVIVLSAWLIVDTIIKGVTQNDDKFGMWNKFDLKDCGGVTVGPSGPEVGGGEAVAP